MVMMRVARWMTMAAIGLAGLQTQTSASNGGTSAPASPSAPATLSRGEAAQAPVKAQPATGRRPDVIYVPTNEEVVAAMLKLAGVTKNDVVYDLGCGDGRIPVIAARDFGARGVGIDVDPQRIAEANENVKKNLVTGKVRIVQADLFEADIKEATVVTLYLLQTLNEKLKPKLMRDLKPGTRIVSHAFDMGDWAPEKTQEVGGTRIYLWTIPPPKK